MIFSFLLDIFQERFEAKRYQNVIKNAGPYYTNIWHDFFDIEWPPF